MTPRRQRIGRSISCLAVLLPVFFTGLLATGCRGEPAPDNLLLIVVDTLRADHLGAWGYPHPTSPRLDALAHGGVRVARFFSTSAWTRPGMASLLTGQYPRTTGIYEERFDALAPELETLAERLHTRGYLTLGVTSNPNVNAWFGFDQGFDLYGDSGVVWPWMPASGGAAVFHRDGADLDDATTVTDRALAALDRKRGEQPDKPFYLQLLYVDPHRPYEPPERYLRTFSEAGSRHPGYDGEIRYTDTEIGRLLDGLEQRGLLANTLVVVTSDHGEGLDDHPSVPLSHAHGNIVYDSVLHVPLLFSHPDLPQGRVVEALASSIDLVPTVLELLGAKTDVPEGPGRSLAPLLRGGRDASWRRDKVYSETDWRANRKLTVRTASERFIRNDDSLAYQSMGVFEGRALSPEERRQLAEAPAEELYREGAAPEDPAVSNLLTSEPETAAELAAELTRWERAVPARPPLRRDPEIDVLTTPGGVVPRRGETANGTATEPPATIDPELRDQLRALGYLDGGGG